MPIYFAAVWIFGVQMAAQRTFVGLGKAKTSLFIALLRKVILLIPLALILPNFIGVPTVIEGKVEDGKLRITAHDLYHRTVAGSYLFPPR